MAGKKAPATRIQNYGKGHGYFLDSEKCPGVTTILGDGLPKPALLDWAGKMTAQFVVNRLRVAERSDGTKAILADDVVKDAIAWNETRPRPERVSHDALDRLALEKILKDIRYRDLDEASNRGTEVHKLAHQLALGEEVDVPEILQGHVESYLRFLDEWNPTEAILERVVVNRKYRYMGRLDALAHIPALGDGLGLYDIKTSRSGIFAEVALQLEAYANAETMVVGYDDDNVAIEEPMPALSWIGAVWVRADGYDVYTFERRPDTFRIFLYCQQVGQWLKWPDGPSQSIKSEALTPPKEVHA